MRLEVNRELFVDALSNRLLKKSQGSMDRPIPQNEPSQRAATTPEQDGVALVTENRTQSISTDPDSTIVVKIDNESMELDDELHTLADNIISDLGYLPEQYVSSAVGRAGKGYAAFRSIDVEAGPELRAPVIYDEWDYRRSDFRKNGAMSWKNRYR